MVIDQYLLQQIQDNNQVVVQDDGRQELTTWKGYELYVETGNQRPYLFSSWSDGSTDKKRTIKLTNDYHEIVALFCLDGHATCQIDDECCSGQCSTSSSNGSGTCLPVVDNSDGNSNDERLPRWVGITISILFGIAAVAVGSFIMILRRGRRKKLHTEWGTVAASASASDVDNSHGNINNDNSSDGCDCNKSTTNSSQDQKSSSKTSDEVEAEVDETPLETAVHDHIQTTTTTTTTISTTKKVLSKLMLSVPITFATTIKKRLGSSKKNDERTSTNEASNNNKSVPDEQHNTGIPSSGSSSTGSNVALSDDEEKGNMTAGHSAVATAASRVDTRGSTRGDLDHNNTTTTVMSFSYATELE
jgi:hypothetical protein